MTDATLTHLVRSYLALPLPNHNFAFQGGEPLLMGLDFYKKLVKLQRRYARPGAHIQNCVQSNCTLVTEEMAEFFTKNNFLVGMSVDGPAPVHDERRPDAAGHGSHSLVMRGLDKLKAAGTEYNILTLVSQSNVHDPVGTYRYLRDELGTKFMQFIECIEFDDHDNLLSYAISADEWADFICAVFDEWYPNDRTTVSVRLFDSIVGKILTGQANSCAMGSSCDEYLVVEHNGDIYPCDFFVRPELKLGNLMEQDWDEILDNPMRKCFACRKCTKNVACKSCPYDFLCEGDCPKNRTGHDASRDPRKLSFLCEAWKRIYGHILPKLREEAEKLRPNLNLPPNA